MSDNQYIPKYISKTPWYHKTGKLTEDLEGKEDTLDLSHQYKNPNVKEDHSVPKSGTGVLDEFVKTKDNIEIKKVEDWDSRRDRWHGFDISEWDKVAQNWETIKKNSGTKKSKQVLYVGLQNKGDDLDEDGSDDTDYELELTELGLDRKDLKSKLKEDPLEKVLRDRQDVPSYILNITSQSKLTYDPQNKNISNDQSEFVRSATVGVNSDIAKLQNFAWEQNETSEKLRKQQKLEERLNGVEGSGIEVDLDLNLAANPTAMLLKSRKEDEKLQKSRELKRQKLNERYG